MTGPDRLIRAITAQLDWLAARRRRIKRISGEEKASSRQHVVWLSGRKNVQCLEQAVPLLNHEENWKCMRERCVSSSVGLGSLRYCRRNGWRNSGKKTPPKLWEKENINSRKTENISWCRGSRAQFCCITWVFTFNSSFSWEREICLICFVCYDSSHWISVRNVRPVLWLLHKHQLLTMY